MAADEDTPCGPCRERLPDTREAITHKFVIDQFKGYVTVGLYADGRPGELFVVAAKEGSTMGGLLDVVGILMSLCLQYGVPLDAIVKKLSKQRFEPSGHTENPDIPFVDSVVDYIAQWMGQQFNAGVSAEMGEGS